MVPRARESAPESPTFSSNNSRLASVNDDAQQTCVTPGALTEKSDFLQPDTEQRENIMHWQIATAVRDMNAADNSVPFTITACRREGASTQELKKVTCKVCKPLISQPRSTEQVANVLFARAVQATDNDHWVTFHCNGCDCSPIDSQEFTYEPQWVSIQRLVTLIHHAAHDHYLGTEVCMSVHTTPLSVYELNLAVGKEPGTMHEEKWRERVLNPEKV